MIDHEIETAEILSASHRGGVGRGLRPPAVTAARAVTRDGPIALALAALVAIVVMTDVMTDAMSARTSAKTSVKRSVKTSAKTSARMIAERTKPEANRIVIVKHH